MELYTLLMIGSIDISDTFAEALWQLSNVGGTGVYIQESPSRILHSLAIEYAKREFRSADSCFYTSLNSESRNTKKRF